MRKTYACIICEAVTVYHKPSYPCGTCGAESRWVVLWDKKTPIRMLKEKGENFNKEKAN